MKQLIQSLKSGSVELLEVPAPAPRRHEVLIRTRVSLVSAGTERMLLEFGRGGWVAKARAQPDKVKQVLQKAATDGIPAAIEAVRARLEQPLPMGYCNVGEVISVGDDVTGFAVGQRVASNGPHAELACVPATLCAAIPDNVTDEDAAFAVLGAIALQGVRLVEPTLGEKVVVVGLGLVGLLSAQLLRASGCRVLGLDPSAGRCDLARTLGLEAIDTTQGDAVTGAMTWAPAGVDAVLIAASSDSDELVHQAATMSRKRGRIVLVGVAGLGLRRDDFYKKELRFQVSCAYGPGRYDPSYEEEGRDYPIGFVRWTAQRNFEAVLGSLATGALRVAPLVTHRFPIERAAEAYEALLVGGALGILLAFPSTLREGADHRTVVFAAAAAPTPAIVGSTGVAVLGAGNHGVRMLIPALRRAGADLRVVASARGLSAADAARRFGIARATTDAATAFDDAAVGAVVVATRHDSHARLAMKALAAGKHVFVEKPLALTIDELDGVERAARSAPGLVLMVGFNRRFAPHVVRLRGLLAKLSAPKTMIMTVNAGAVPADHWTRDRKVGGGRLVGEACHFIDLLRHLAGAAITSHAVLSHGDDAATIAVTFADGSTGVIHYLTNGHRGVPKERLEVFCDGRVMQIDNFRKLRAYGVAGAGWRSWKQDKGNNACIAAFLAAIRGEAPPPIPLEEVLEVARVSIVVEAAHGCRARWGCDAVLSAADAARHSPTNSGAR